ncbi:MAG: hypothetical protein HC828_04425 [Blastochloris sp.]|nr:hypothetical protein [Blastochloris sp.]
MKTTTGHGNGLFDKIAQDDAFFRRAAGIAETFRDKLQTIEAMAAIVAQTQRHCQ